MKIALIALNNSLNSPVSRPRTLAEALRGQHNGSMDNDAHIDPCGFSEAPRILVVDDERAIAELVASLLASEGMRVHVCYSGPQALEALQAQEFDLGIFDVMMPVMDGFELCARVRSFSEMPIVFLSAKDEEADQVVGFTLGADDYVTKPFKPRELVARVRARLRRASAPTQPPRNDVIRAGAVEVDLRAHRATLHGEPLRLTPKEFAILSILAKNAGSPVSAASLFEQAWDERYDDSAANTVMVHIRHLRKKLSEIDSSTAFIETAWGVGYRLRDNLGTGGPASGSGERSSDLSAGGAMHAPLP